MPATKDLITENNVIKTYQEGKYVCFLLSNNMTVKLNPNEVRERGEQIKKRRVKK